MLEMEKSRCRHIDYDPAKWNALRFRAEDLSNSNDDDGFYWLVRDDGNFR